MPEPEADRDPDAIAPAPAWVLRAATLLGQLAAKDGGRADPVDVALVLGLLRAVEFDDLPVPVLVVHDDRTVQASWQLGGVGVSASALAGRLHVGLFAMGPDGCWSPREIPGGCPQHPPAALRRALARAYPLLVGGSCRWELERELELKEGESL